MSLKKKDKITMHQVSYLSLISDAIKGEPFLGTLDLSDKLNIAPKNLIKHLKDFEELWLITRKRDSTLSPNKKIISITLRGQRVIDSYDKLHQALQKIDLKFPLNTQTQPIQSEASTE